MRSLMACKQYKEFTEDGYKKTVLFYAVYEPKVHKILRRHRRPLIVSNALARLSIFCFVPKIQAVKVTVKFVCLLIQLTAQCNSTTRGQW